MLSSRRTIQNLKGPLSLIEEFCGTLGSPVEALWTPCGEPYGTSVESFQKVADPRRTVLDSIETCASLCKLREPFCTFWNLCRTFQKLLVRFRTDGILKRFFQSFQQPHGTFANYLGTYANHSEPHRTSADLGEAGRTSANPSDPQRTAESLRELERTLEDRAERWRTVANLGEPERTFSNIERASGDTRRTCR